MLVVADATPLHDLILLDEVDLPRKLYERSWCLPRSLANSLRGKLHHRFVPGFSVPPAWLGFAPAPDPLKLPFASLGLGERQAIFLAQDTPGSLLLTDDRQAREAALTLGIQAIPTIRILSTASDLVMIDFNEAFTRLQQTNFRLSRKVLDTILNRLPVD